MQNSSSGNESATTAEKSLPPFSIPVVWTWKETRFRVSTHPKSSVWGDVEGCWIKYRDEWNAKLEKAYRQYVVSGNGDSRYCDLPTYTVDFLRMVQTNRNTIFQRKVERHVAFRSLLKSHYDEDEDHIDDAYQCCDSLNKIMGRIEHEVREAIDRDAHFGIQQDRSSSRIVDYFRKKQVDCFMQVFHNCRTIFKLCCERAGVSSEYRCPQVAVGPDNRSPAECCLGEDAREMCLHFINFVNERLSITDERVATAIEKLLVLLRRMQIANKKRLFALGVARGDSSRPLKSSGWSQKQLIHELNIKTQHLIESTSHDASSFRPETKTFLRTLHKYLDCRKKMDARYLEVDEFQLIAHRSLSTDSGGILLLDLSGGDSTHAKPAYQQQSISGTPVATMDELFEAATITQPYYRELIENTMKKLRGTMGNSVETMEKPSVTFGDLKDRVRAHEKAQDDYGNFIPGPGFCWLYDIVRGSIEFHSAVEVIAFVALLEEDEAIHIVKAKNRFQNPSLTGYRDLCIQFQLSLSEGFKHICEIQIHHHAIKILDKELNTHQYYEYFRSYFAGATRSLKDRLEDLQLIAGNGTVDESFLHLLIPTCVEEKRLERLGFLFEVQLSEYHWAMRAYSSLLDLRIRKFGQRHPATARTYCNMGNVKSAQGKIEDAAMYYKASLRSDQSSSIILASTYRGMAKVFELQKKTDDATALFQSIIETGENLPVQVVVDSHVEMANLLRDRGDFDRAMEFYEGALEISKLKYGEEHQHVAIILQNMARIFRCNGDSNAATELYQKSLDVTKRTLGEDHLSTAEIYQSIGLMTQSQGSLESAFDLYSKALKMYQKRFGEFHSQVADSYDMLASVRWQQNLYHEARDLHENSRRIRSILNARKSSREHLPISLTAEHPNFDEHLVGESHPYFVFSLRCRCKHLLHSDNPEQSLLPYRELVDILQRNFDDQQTEIASSYQDMATLLRRLGRLDEAMETYDTFRSLMSQEKYKKLGAEYKFEWAMAYEEMARLLQEQSRESDALEVIVEALEMRKEMALKSGIHTLKILFTFKSFIKISEQALENNQDELFCAKVTNAKRAVLASGLEIYHELLMKPSYKMHRETMMKQHNQMDRLGSVLFDALTNISGSIGGFLHEQLCDLGGLVLQGDAEALGARLPNMIEYLRDS